MIRHRPSSRPKATPEKQGEVFLAPHGGVAPGTVLQADDPRAAGGVTDHGALTGLADDDHTQYQKESEKSAANGYASLDAGTLVPVAELPAATTAAKGVAELATSGENAANVAVQGDDARINVVTTKGDIYSASAANTPARKAVGADGTVLSADSAQATGLNYITKNSVNLGLGGSWIYGDGADGDLTLTGDTTMTLNENVKAYASIDLAGYTLTYHTSDFYATLQASVILDGNGGTITSVGKTTSIPGAIQAGGRGGDGGAGSLGAGSLYVFSKLLVDVTITSTGAAASAGGAGSTGAGAGAGVIGNAASAFNTASYFCGTLYAATTSGVGNAGAIDGAGGAGGAGGDITAANRLITRRSYNSIFRIVGAANVPAINAPLDFYRHASISGSSGGSGAGGQDGGTPHTFRKTCLYF